MATFAALAEAIWTQLENVPMFPLAEVYANGLNPAMTLLALLHPSWCLRRTVTTLPAYSLTLDLRQLAPRTHQVVRVLLGRAPGDVSSPTAGQYDPLRPTTHAALAKLTPHWLRATGVPRRWFLLGAHLLAVHPRPVVDMDMTIITAVIPTRATLDNQTRSPDFDAAHDDELIDVAVALLRLKEGSVETLQALTQLPTRLGLALPAQAKAS
jgi:hypothetical protein